MKYLSLSPVKKVLCVNDNYLFLVIHLCAIAFIARILSGILYPPITYGDAVAICKASGVSSDLLEIMPAFFWYASIPFLYIVWKRVGGAAFGLIVSIVTVVPGFFIGE